MDEYTFIACAMRAVRLYAIVLSMAMAWYWGPSLWRIVSGRAPAATLILDEHPRLVALDREWMRAIDAVLAFAVFLLQIRWLTPSMPEIAQLRIWLFSLAVVDAVLLARIFRHGRTDPRFDGYATARAWAAIFVGCILFAVLTR